MNTVIFTILYLFFMLFTYVWRLSAFSASVGENVSADSVSTYANTATILLLINYLILILIAYFRGKRVNKKSLVAFPFIGAVLDIVLAFIPFVPTIMNIITLVFGISENKTQVVYVQDSSKQDKKNEKNE